jgi:hypothetical protein
MMSESAASETGAGGFDSLVDRFRALEIKLETVLADQAELLAENAGLRRELAAIHAELMNEPSREAQTQAQDQAEAETKAET